MAYACLIIATTGALSLLYRCKDLLEQSAEKRNAQGSRIFSTAIWARTSDIIILQLNAPRCLTFAHLRIIVINSFATVEDECRAFQTYESITGNSPVIFCSPRPPAAAFPSISPKSVIRDTYVSSVRPQSWKYIGAPACINIFLNLITRSNNAQFD